MTEQPQHRTCPNCQEPATMTEWVPDPGLDTSMREYKCPHCGYEWFHSRKVSIVDKTPRPTIFSTS